MGKDILGRNLRKRDCVLCRLTSLGKHSRVIADASARPHDRRANGSARRPARRRPAADAPRRAAPPRPAAVNSAPCAAAPAPHRTAPAARRPPALRHRPGPPRAAQPPRPRNPRRGFAPARHGSCKRPAADKCGDKRLRDLLMRIKENQGRSIKPSSTFSGYSVIFLLLKLFQELYPLLPRTGRYFINKSIETL